ncbi:MAG TPA: glycoside hydrolase family protein [Polyangia bacterium]|nr:glycoside hydrolase family protein [Polyangia bacterium]
MRLFPMLLLAMALDACGSSSGRGAGTPGTAGAGAPGGGAGQAATGGVAGAAATGGTAGNAAAGGAGGTGGGCKRGIASNTAPGAAFFPAVSWWYNWSLQPSGGDTGIAFVPMVWGASTVSGAIPAGSRFLLGFNEPNFMSQSNLTPAQAAADWAALQANAARSALAIVGPAMNFCGPAASCNGTDPYQYLTTFFADCAGCQVDYVAAHWYNCDLKSLQDYLEPGGSLAGYEQFGKPIWLTEFSCDGSATAAQQEAYMRAAVPYLESNPHVFRYSWFSASPIPNAQLVNGDGSPTALGQVYISLAQTCP